MSKTDPWINVAANQVIIEEGLRVTKLREISALVESDILDEVNHHRGSRRARQYFCDEHYASLVLYPKKMSAVPENRGKFTEELEKLKRYNDLLHDRLAKQIREKIEKIEVPVLINLSDLRIDTNEKDYAFFNLAKGAEIILVPQFSTENLNPNFNNTHLEPFQKSFYRTSPETGAPTVCYEPRENARWLCLSGGGVNELYLFERDFHVSFLGFHSLGKLSGGRSGLAKITIVDELK